MSFHTTLPFRPKISVSISDTPILNPLSPSKKRMREVSVQEGTHSEMEEATPEVEDKAEAVATSTLFASAPLSRKQRRRQLRSVSKQSGNLQMGAQLDIQPNVAVHDSKQGSSFSSLVVGSDRVRRSTSSAVVSEHASVLLQLMRSPNRGHTEEQVPGSSTTPTRSAPTTTHPPSEMLGDGDVAALGGNEQIQIAENVVDIVVAEYHVEEKDTKGQEIVIQVKEIELEDDDILDHVHVLKQKKRPRVFRERKRKERQNVSESTFTSTENEDDSVETSTIIIATEYDHADEGNRDRKQSIAISITDTLIEETISSQDEDTSSSNLEGISPKKRPRSQNEDEDLPATRLKISEPEKEEIPTPVEGAKKEDSFIETIRQMFTSNKQTATEVASPTTSPIPKKFISPPKISIDSELHKLNLLSSLNEAEVEAPHQYGPNPRPLMPRSWSEARTWDMTPPIHGTRKTYTNDSQLQYENLSSTNRLSLKAYPYTLPPLTTLWAVSKYLKNKQAMNNEHSRREGLRWQVMKAVERNLDIVERRKGDWPKNWNVEVRKDEGYMRRMRERVRFLMRS
ncbi:hypothetical protein VTL71DRAFT_1680 [Oculimacula yallundae]|uniref:Uncharacterized protein n=1 Tax=Oculimacula yallundae TaxID=86028 RepID=A0ABR4CBD8_9HELO